MNSNSMQELGKVLEDYVKQVSSEDAVKVFRLLYGKVNISEFDLAEELNLSINYVRNLLYSLHAHNLVRSTRKKDREKGWYIYYWTFNLKHAVGVLSEKKKSQLAKLEKSLNNDREAIYICPDGHVKVNSINGMELGFRCPECEQVLVIESSERNKEQIQSEIEKTKKEIEILEKPFDIPVDPEEEKAKRTRVVKKPAKKVIKKKKLSKKVLKKSPKKALKKKKTSIKKLKPRTFKKPNKKATKKITKKKTSIKKPRLKILKKSKKKATRNAAKKSIKKKKPSKKKRIVNMEVSVSGVDEVKTLEIPQDKPVEIVQEKNIELENAEENNSQDPADSSEEGLFSKIKKIRKRVGF